MMVWAGLPLSGWAQSEEYEIPVSIDEVFDQAVDLYDQWVPEDIKDQFDAPTREAWGLFWNQVQQSLETGSLDDLTWMTPYVESALEFLESSPSTQGYADWLRQRADYFDMAKNVSGLIAVPGVTPTPEPRAPRHVLRAAPPARRAPIPATVAKYRQVYVQSAKSWERKLKDRPKPARAGELIPTIKSAFSEEGVPEQWVWMAEVESSLNPSAISPVGAVGLFQFMPATAKRFGLKTQPKDERLVPEKSARAAARYLKVLYKQFQSWPLSLAAYNAGEGRVSKKLAASSVKTFEAIENTLPLETQMYVPKIMALVALREGIDPLSLPGPTVERRLRNPIMVTARLP